MAAPRRPNLLKIKLLSIQSPINEPFSFLNTQTSLSFTAALV